MENQFLRSRYQINLTSYLDKQLIEKENQYSISHKKYKKNNYIYSLGDLANKVYIIKKGRVKISINGENSRRIIKNVLMDGEIFGELTLLGETYRSDFAMTMEDTELYVISVDEIIRQMQCQNNLTNYIINVLGTRLGSVERKIESFLFNNARTRIIDFLEKLAKEQGQRVGYEIVIHKIYTHQEIADITLTSRQTVTTLLNNLRNKGILIFNRKRLLIRDLNLLKAEAYTDSL